MPILQIGEFSEVNVDDSFLKLSPDEQQQTVNNIHQQLLAGQTSSDQAIDAPPERDEDQGFFDRTGEMIEGGARRFAGSSAYGLATGLEYLDALPDFQKELKEYSSEQEKSSKDISPIKPLQEAESVGDVASSAWDYLSQSSPYMAAMLGGAYTGAKAGAALPLPPQLRAFTGFAGGLLGGAVATYNSFFGENIKESEEKKKRKLTKEEIEGAAAAAVGQSIADAVISKILPAKGSPKVITNTLKKLMQAGAVEGSTEVFQESLGILQANDFDLESLKTPEAIYRLKEAGLAGTAIGAPIGAVTGPFTTEVTPIRPQLPDVTEGLPDELPEVEEATPQPPQQLIASEEIVSTPDTLYVSEQGEIGDLDVEDSTSTLQKIKNATPNVSPKQTYPPEVLEKIRANLTKRLQARGISEKVALIITESLNRPEIAGEVQAAPSEAQFTPQNQSAKAAIMLSLDALPEQTLKKPKLMAQYLAGLTDHETVHSWVDLGVINDKDMNSLAKAALTAKHWSDPDKTVMEVIRETYSDLDETAQIEEAAAEMFRGHASGQQPLTGRPLSIWQRILNFFRSVKGGLAEADIFKAQQVFERVEFAPDFTGRVTPEVALEDFKPEDLLVDEDVVVEAAPDRQARFFHGGPNEWKAEPGKVFGVPRLEFMGTGEGAQAFGWGFYSAQSPTVAKSYLSDEWDFSKEDATPPQGTLYKLDIPDADIEKYLDWDKSLSEQPKKVLEKIEPMIRSAEGYNPSTATQSNLSKMTSATGALRPAITGEIFYEVLALDLGSDKAASEALRKVGIPGLKFYDAFSREPKQEVLVNGDPIDPRDNLSQRAELWLLGAKGSIDAALSDLEAHIRETKRSFEILPRDTVDSLEDVREVLRDWAEDPGQIEIIDIERTRNYVTWDQDVLDRSEVVGVNKVPVNQIAVNLSAATGSIPGLKNLQDEANSGDKEAEQLLQDVASDSLMYLLSGIPDTRILPTSAQGLYFGGLEPSIGLDVGFAQKNRKDVLAALAQFANNFNQEQVHVRTAPDPDTAISFVYPDGSFNTASVRFNLKKPLTRQEVEEVINYSGLAGMTATDTYLDVYYLGDPSDKNAIQQFKQATRRASQSLEGRTERINSGIQRLWAYGDGYGATNPYSDIRGPLRPPNAEEGNRTSWRIAQRLRGRPLIPVPSQQSLTSEQRDLQSEIADAYDDLPINDLGNPKVRKAYEELARELNSQYQALPINVEVWGGEGEPYANSNAMRKDVSENNHLYIYGTEAKTFGPPGVVYDNHPMLKRTAFTDMNGKPLLVNDLLRAVHDYYAHTMAPNKFGPLGEEAAWQNHMLMTRSPWARWALTSETRGQNSWVNFHRLMISPTKRADILPITERQFSEQKTALLPIQYTMTGDPVLDQEMMLLDESIAQDKQARNFYYPLRLSKNKGNKDFPSYVVTHPNAESYLEGTGNNEIRIERNVDDPSLWTANGLVESADSPIFSQRRDAIAYVKEVLDNQQPTEADAQDKQARNFRNLSPQQQALVGRRLPDGEVSRVWGSITSTGVPKQYKGQSIPVIVPRGDRRTVGYEHAQEHEPEFLAYTPYENVGQALGSMMDAYADPARKGEFRTEATERGEYGGFQISWKDPKSEKIIKAGFQFLPEGTLRGQKRPFFGLATIFPEGPTYSERRSRPANFEREYVDTASRLARNGTYNLNGVSPLAKRTAIEINMPTKVGPNTLTLPSKQARPISQKYSIKSAPMEMGVEFPSGIVEEKRHETLGQKFLGSLGMLGGTKLDSFGEFGKWFRQNVIDNWDPARRGDVAVSEKDARYAGALSASGSAHAALRMARRGTAITAYALSKGVPVYRGGGTKVEAIPEDAEQINFDGTRERSRIAGTNTGFIPIIEPLRNGNRFNAFHFYSIARRAARLIQEGREILLTQEQIAQYLALGNNVSEIAQIMGVDVAQVNTLIGDRNIKFNKDFSDIFQDYQVWNGYFVDFLVDTGVLDAAKAEKWKETGDYIPFYRQLDSKYQKEENQGEISGEGNMFAGITTHVPPVLKGTGTVYAVIATDADGNETMLPTTFDAKEKTIAEAYAKKYTDETGVSTRVSRKGMPIGGFLDTVTENALSAVQTGMLNVGVQRAMRNMAILDPTQTVKIKKGSTNSITFRVNGKEMTLHVSDPAMYSALYNYGSNQQINPFVNFLGMPARFLREMVTRSPDFMVANMLRDSISAWATSGRNTGALAGTTSGWVKALKGSTSADAIASAGLMTGFDFGGDPSKMTDFIEKELLKYKYPSKMGRIIRNPLKAIWDASGTASRASDAATRIAVYEKVLQETGDEVQAIYEAQEVINFSARGSSAVIQNLAVMVPFLNARLQGLDVLYRASMGAKGFTPRVESDLVKRRFITRALLVGMSSAAYWALVHDDEEYINQNPEIKDNYWIIPSSWIPGYEGPPLRIPIPFEVGFLFKTLPERTMALMFGKDVPRDTVTSLAKGLANTFEFNPIPQAVLPIGEAITNFSFWTGREIEGAYLERLEPGYRANSRTSALAIELGQALNASPVKIDHMIKGYSGTLGTVLFDTIDQVMRQTSEELGERPSKQLSEYPFIKRFFARPDARGLVTQFYDLRKAVGQAVSTLKNLEQGELTVTDAEKFEEKRLELLDLEVEVEAIAEVLSELRKERLDILRSNLSAEAKRDFIKEITAEELLAVEAIPELRQEAFQ